MNQNKVFFISCQFLAFAMILICSASSWATPQFQQTPIILKASEQLPANLIKGDNYRIAETIQNDGAINTYHLDTDDGFIFAESTAELLVRINELKALAKMNKMEHKGVFKDSLVTGVKAPVKLAEDLVTSPIKTTKHIIKGTGGFISNAGRSIFSRDPHQDNILEVALGYDATKRNFAYEFLINPYSNYEPVVLRLGSISKAAVTGGILPKVAMTAVGGTIGTIAGRPFLKNRDGIIVLPLPVDYIFWTETVAAKLQALENALASIKDVKGKEIWINGKIEHNAATQFALRDWKIIQDANNKLIK